MPNPRKLFMPNTLVMVTFRTEEGLPLGALKYINRIILSAMARAYELYPVQLCGFSYEPNHGHLSIYVTDPELVSLFVGYVKQEIAHAINRLLGRPRKTVWIEGFDSPTILDVHTALDKFAYVLLNPVKDRLVSRMDEYPGVSSYSLLMSGKDSVTTERVFRDSVVRLKDPERPWLEEESYKFEDDRKSTVTLELFPYAWKKCFPETRDLSDAEVREMMINYIRTEEEKFPKEHLNPERLKRRSLIKHYSSKKFGKRMVCLSIFKPLRRGFIRFYKRLCEQAQDAFKQWQAFNFVPFPIGLFPPCLPRRANLMPVALTLGF